MLLHAGPLSFFFFVSGAPSRLVDVILGGKLDALRHDLPELPELDNLFAPEVGVLDFLLGEGEIEWRSQNTEPQESGGAVGERQRVSTTIRFQRCRSIERTLLLRLSTNQPPTAALRSCTTRCTGKRLAALLCK